MRFVLKPHFPKLLTYNPLALAIFVRLTMRYCGETTTKKMSYVKETKH